MKTTAEAQRCSPERPPARGSEVRICSGTYAGIDGRVTFVDLRRGVAGLRLVMFARQAEPVEVPLRELELVRARRHST